MTWGELSSECGASCLLNVGRVVLGRVLFGASCLGASCLFGELPFFPLLLISWTDHFLRLLVVFYPTIFALICWFPVTQKTNTGNPGSQVN